MSNMFQRIGQVAIVLAGSALGVGGLYMWMSILGAFDAVHATIRFI